MLTVKEFEDLGLDWSEDDIITINGRNMYLEVELAQELNEGGYECKYSECEVESFAWRPLNTLPDNPKFKYEVGNHGLWRPLLDQSQTETKEEKEVFDKMKPYEFDAHVSSASMADYEDHKANSELLSSLNKFMSKNNIGKAGENCVDVAIRELSEKHNIDNRTPKQKAVDEMLQIIDDQCSRRKACEIIYDMLVDEK